MVRNPMCSLGNSIRKQKIFLRYLEIKDLFKIPIDVAMTYLKYRRIFKGTPYQIMLKKCDEMYNRKIPRTELRAR